MSAQQNGQEQPDPEPEPDPHAPSGFVRVWSAVRPVPQLLLELMAGQHEGLYLTAQALMVLGDLAAAYLQCRRR